MSVFTPVSHKQLLKFLTLYDIGEVLDFQGIGEGVENSNFFVDTEQGRWVLTLFERLNYDDLPFFLGLMEHLADAGLPCAAPLKTKDGRSLVELNGKPAAMVHRLTGQSVLFPNVAQCRAAGELMGRMHKATESFDGTAVNTRGAGWRRDTAQTLAAELPEDARKLIESEIQEQSSFDMTSLRQGVIHADMFRDNVLFIDDRLSGVIDFYYACNEALLYDLAIAVNDWCMDTHGAPEPGKVKAMTQAYVEQRQPDDGEIAAWPMLLRAAALRFYLSRLEDWLHPREGGIVHVKDPVVYQRILEHHRDAPMALF